MRHASFPPVVDDRTETLILGSLPGAASLAAGRYYANPRNQFWRLVGGTIGADLVGLDYTERLRILLAHGIGLWDVIAEAERAGSLDAAIRNVAGNDLVALTDTLPKLRTIAFNGGKASTVGRAQLGVAGERFRLVTLPSSSPALTWPFADKLASWQQLSDQVSS